MAALGSSVTSTGLALHTTVILHRRHGNSVVSASSHHQRSLNGLSMNSSGMNNALPIRGTTRIPAVGPGASSSGGNLPIPNIPPWARWLVGAVIFAVPMSGQFGALEDNIEKKPDVAIEVIHKVAEATKVANEVADEFPGNGNIREAASKIKKVMDLREEDAGKAEALSKKVSLTMQSIIAKAMMVNEAAKTMEKLADAFPGNEETIKAAASKIKKVTNFIRTAASLIEGVMEASEEEDHKAQVLIEKTAEVAVEVIDKVAEATEKVADEFPGNETIKAAASKIKKVMDVIEEDADKAQALIEKVSSASKIKKVMDVIEEDTDKAQALMEKVDEIMEEVHSVVDKVAKGKSETKKDDNNHQFIKRSKTLLGR